MKHFLPLLFLALLLFQVKNPVVAQSTYAQVYQLVQTHCAGSSCHDGSVPTFNINVSADSFYHEIIGKTPVNPAAAANYNTLISPGDVQHSFLLRKISHGISDGLKLSQPAEGLDMPNGLPALANNEIELVRQWILYGAPETGNVVDTSLINTYYRTGGMNDVYGQHDPPAPGTGFQIYYGRFFMNKGISDTEVFYKVNPHIDQAIEAYKVSYMMPSDDHHFIMYLFQPGGDVNYPYGIRPLSDGSMEYDQFGIGSTGTWSIELPTGTAFYFNPGQMFDLDLHLTNPSYHDSIYSCEMYINVYTEPATTTTTYMRMESFVNMNIAIPHDGQTHTYPLLCQDSSRSTYWNLWKLSSHTHRYGTAFNIWLQNPDGSKGAQIYDGNYSYEDGFDVGYYRWGPHATFRTWPGDSLFPINPLSGVIGEATWLNTMGPDTVWWGFSSLDEMEAVYFYYVDGEALPTAVNTVPANNFSARVFPNPVSDAFILKYDLDQPTHVQVDLLDVLGNKVANLVNEQGQAPGQYTHDVNASEYKLQPGIYLVAFNIGGKIETQKLIITE